MATGADATGADGPDRRRAGCDMHVVERGELRYEDQEGAERGGEHDRRDHDSVALAGRGGRRRNAREHGL